MANKNKFDFTQYRGANTSSIRVLKIIENLHYVRIVLLYNMYLLSWVNYADAINLSLLSRLIYVCVSLLVDVEVTLSRGREFLAFNLPLRKQHHFHLMMLFCPKRERYIYIYRCSTSFLQENIYVFFFLQMYSATFPRKSNIVSLRGFLEN